MKLASRGLAVPFILAVLFPFYTLGQEVKIDAASGLYIAILETEKGDVKVYIPDGLASGDMISATVVLEPEGKTEDEKRRNEKELSEYSLELEREKRPTSRRNVKWTIPPGITGGVTYIVLRDDKENELVRAAVPVRTAPTSMEQVPNPNAFEYEFPIIGQAGEAAQIKGPFDGDFDTTNLKIGGKEVNLIAESPRRLVFKSPKEVIGQTQMELREGKSVLRRGFKNLRVIKIDSIPKEKTIKTKADEETPVKKTPTPPGQEEVKTEERIPAPSHTRRVEASQMNFSLVPKYVQIPTPTETEEKEPLPTPHAFKNQEEKTEPKSLKIEAPSSPTQKEPIDVKAENEENAPTDTAPATTVEAYGIYTVQVASFKSESDARDLAEGLKSRGYPAFVKRAEIPRMGTWHRVRIGAFRTIGEARLFGHDLRRRERGIQSFLITPND